MNTLNALIAKISNYNDILLIFLLVAVISLMILPMPPFMIDFLISVNLMMSVIILMIAMYIPGALAFSVFPSLLLFTTLYRLALAIATTRMILLKANAGEIILTFGQYVVGGNFVVGAVVFLIITIVQFLVIAKGAERVAEVAARFTLDAMPGKQMSIDADMRAGVIDVEEARERRELVTKESQLYGAMDGAMKFVKGDAIASLIITAVNIVGGLCIGILMNGKEAGWALKKYGILTIGDGLVSQIPALLICISAGVIVTRVSTKESRHLGGDIGNQVLGQPKAIFVTGILLFAFGMVPGFPKIQIFALAGVVALVGYSLMKLRAVPAENANDRLQAALAPAADKDKPKKRSSGEVEDFSITVPLLVDIAESVKAAIKPEDLNEEVIKVRRALYYDLGVPFPGIHLRFREDIEPDSYNILLHEVPMSKGWLPKGKIFVRESEEHLTVMGFKFESGKPFLPSLATIWVNEAQEDKLRRGNLAYLTISQVLSYHLSFILKKHASDFLGIQETRFLLGQMEGKYSELAKEVQRIMPLQKVAEILRRLVQEQVSIRNLRAVLESFVEWGQKEKDSVLLAEYVRSSLSRQISHQYTGGQNVLPVYMLDPNLEEKIRSAIRQTSSGSYLALDPDTTKNFVQKMVGEAGNIHDMPHKPVLLTSMDIRRYVRKLIEKELYELPVLSYQELTQEVTVQPLSKIAL